MRFIVKLPIFALLYLFNAEFRAVVKSKFGGKRGTDEQVKTGEEVVAVLNGKVII